MTIQTLKKPGAILEDVLQETRDSHIAPLFRLPSRLADGGLDLTQDSLMMLS